jgi:hypothetical protein
MFLYKETSRTHHHQPQIQNISAPPSPEYAASTTDLPSVVASHDLSPLSSCFAPTPSNAQMPLLPMTTKHPTRRCTHGSIRPCRSVVMLLLAFVAGRVTANSRGKGEQARDSVARRRRSRHGLGVLRGRQRGAAVELGKCPGRLESMQRGNGLGEAQRMQRPPRRRHPSRISGPGNFSHKKRPEGSRSTPSCLRDSSFEASSPPGMEVGGSTSQLLHCLDGCQRPNSC